MHKRIIIADDHPLVREGLKYILSSEQNYVVAAEVSDGNQLVKKVSEDEFDIALVDMFMPGISGIELIQRLRVDAPNLKILIISSHKEDIYAVRTIRAGAAGYLCKDYAASTLLIALRKIASGGKYITENVAQQLALACNVNNTALKQHDMLSNREYRVFLMIATGKSVTAIAEELNLSVKTVSTYKARIMEKMSLKNSVEILRYVIEYNLLEQVDNAL